MRLRPLQISMTKPTTPPPTRPRFTFAPELIAPNVYRIPVPFARVSSVNVFAFIAADGVRLIDAGPMEEAGMASLFAQLASLGLGIGDIRAVFISHGHGDHFGGSERMGDAGARVLMLQNEQAVERDVSWLERHGLPPGATGRFRGGDLPSISEPVHDGQRLDWGIANLEVIWSPGHTPGLASLYEPDLRLLFTSDHVMRRDESQISIASASGFDRLGAYLESVRKLKATPAQTVLPGHGRGFGGLTERLDEILVGADVRLAILMDSLASGPAQASELSLLDGLNFKHPSAQTGPQQLQTAIIQVLSHLIHLERLGQVRQLSEGEKIFWERV
jgi:glyoxylase-like metal-dependent hydrolase (beta-lactamase superfamily II)